MSIPSRAAAVYGVPECSAVLIDCDYITERYRYMFEVISNDILAPNLHRMVVRAPRVATARKAGQFVIVRADHGDERIPLTIGDADPATGTITLFIQAIGASTRKIVAIPP